jgi:putative flippase GtrA
MHPWQAHARFVPERPATLARAKIRVKLRADMKALVRCAGSSLAAVAVEFGLLSLLVSLFHVFYLAGALISGVVGLLLAFVLNRSWAFSDGRARAWCQLAKHIFVVVGGIALGMFLLWIAVRHLSLPYQLGWIASGSIVFFVWTFPMQRFFTFRVEPAIA